MGTPRYACLKCDKLIPVGTEVCPLCGEKVKRTMKANLRGAALAAKEVFDEEYNSPEKVAQREEVKKARAEDKEPVSAVLISTDSKKSGAFGRALVGDALFGPMGAIVGASSAKSKATKATFSVKYASGRTATETVDIGSRRFNELSALLHK